MEVIKDNYRVRDGWECIPLIERDETLHMLKARIKTIIEESSDIPPNWKICKECNVSRIPNTWSMCPICTDKI